MSQHTQSDDQNVLSIDGLDTSYEEISSDEVDKVVEVLEDLMARVHSENIRSILDAAADEVYALVYADEETESDAA